MVERLFNLASHVPYSKPVISKKICHGQFWPLKSGFMQCMLGILYPSFPAKTDPEFDLMVEIAYFGVQHHPPCFLKICGWSRTENNPLIPVVGSESLNSLIKRKNTSYW